MVDHTPQPDAASAARLTAHERAQDALARLDDAALAALVADSTAPVSGHATLALPGSETAVFAKLLPLSDLEREPSCANTTANVFQLPSYYQYRLGSLGLGVWRELAAHEQATDWALSGAFAAVPLLHGWRVLPIRAPVDPDCAELTRWGAEPHIARRVAAGLSATACLLLIMESYPETLAQWIRGRLADQRREPLRPQAVEASLLGVLRAVSQHGMLHMDAHLENFLITQDQAVLCDFGLAMAQSFDLSSEERRFFALHETFDRATAVTSLVQTLVTHYDERPAWREALTEIVAGSHATCGAMPTAISEYLALRAPVAVATGSFYDELNKDLATRYPAQAIERALGES